MIIAQIKDEKKCKQCNRYLVESWPRVHLKSNQNVRRNNKNKSRSHFIYM